MGLNLILREVAVGQGQQGPALILDQVDADDGHPYLGEGKGNCSIELLVLMPVPFQQD
jgi:hypothetical protein